MDLRIAGAEDLAAVAKRIRAAGDARRGLKSQLTKAITRATKPLKVEAKKAAAAKLPQSGGLASRVSKTSITTKTLTGRDPAVRIVAKGTALSTDRGYVSHPTFGDRSAWVRQSVTPGWFTDTLANGAPTVRREVIEAMDDIANQIDRGL